MSKRVGVTPDQVRLATILADQERAKLEERRRKLVSARRIAVEMRRASKAIDRAIAKLLSPGDDVIAALDDGGPEAGRAWLKGVALRLKEVALGEVGRAAAASVAPPGAKIVGDIDK